MSKFTRADSAVLDVPVDVLEDRELRNAAERTLSMLLFGDPLPGQSALDKRDDSQ